MTSFYFISESNPRAHLAREYGLPTGMPSMTVRFNVTGTTVIWVDGYADDDQDWPSLSSHQNSLGRAVITMFGTDVPIEHR